MSALRVADRRRRIAATLALGLSLASGEGRVAAAVGASKPLPGSVAESLDRAAIPEAKPWRVHQASGYDRDGGFYDSGNFLRVEAGPQYVLMECDGPGVIDRMWFTYKREFRSEPYNLLIYLDGAPEPAICENLDDLFAIERPPFVRPLSGLCGNPRHPARYANVPLGFATAAKVVLQPTAPADQYTYRENSRGGRIPHVYYQITCRTLPPGASVRRFSWDLEAAERDALAEWRKRCQAAGPAFSADTPGQTRTNLDVEITPGATALLIQCEGPGTLGGLRLQTDRPDALQLLAWWDGAKEPAVAAPFGPFFGCAESVPPTEVRGLWVGYAEKTFYCHLPMPFHESARLLVRSLASDPIRVSGEIALLRERPAPTALQLHAQRYDHNPPQSGADYVVLDLHGGGHFAGLVMDRPGHMEGDDRFYVDGERHPSVHGTGTEDFFNFAWGLSHTGALPLHGITQQPGGPVAYRFHLPAGIPFRKSLRIDWEHGHDPVRGSNLDQRRYSGVVFYYARQGR